MEVAANTSAPPTTQLPNKTAVDAAADVVLVVGIGIGFLALVCLVLLFCRRRRRSSDLQHDDHLHTKIWETATHGESPEGVYVMEEANGKHRASNLFVPEDHGHRGVRPSNIFIRDVVVCPIHSKHHCSKNDDIVLLEDDELMRVSGRYPPRPNGVATAPSLSSLQAIVLQPAPTQPHRARPRLSTEDDSEAGDIVHEKLSLRRSTDSFAQDDDGGWSTNLSFVSEMSLLDSGRGDRMSTISFTSNDDDAMEAKI
ncbi:hypothetical protein H310_06665 [Aphanomyces invadans]|uniref:Uncharacterized protein n=1 Tax=Aphanomyces invadans TaxID=157072 RepID=A0A024U464_9STRA|nr:hypothetical protein H310_06665 [Aphanomyces invadans]ETW01034.1 hypothetical protein H310_06665 [Aphanomyces invadans]|eukprot:XP_008870032.1 hypothetical protein H310_06665 [Aphanomyces invadans]